MHTSAQARQSALIHSSLIQYQIQYVKSSWSGFLFWSADCSQSQQLPKYVRFSPCRFIHAENSSESASEDLSLLINKTTDWSFKVADDKCTSDSKWFIYLHVRTHSASLWLTESVFFNLIVDLFQFYSTWCLYTTITYVFIMLIMFRFWRHSHDFIKFITEFITATTCNFLDEDGWLLSSVWPLIQAGNTQQKNKLL